MKKLREGGMIKMNAEGFITLTVDGAQEAERVYERHSVLYDWLTHIGVPEQLAAADACRIEHILHEETFLAMKKWLKIKTKDQE
jgi:Mn-dependent DtxR family transcriptional regulator